MDNPYCFELRGPGMQRIIKEKRLDGFSEKQIQETLGLLAQAPSQTPEDCYTLPIHSSQTSIDPLGICDADTGTVPQSALLDALIERAEESLQHQGYDAFLELITDIAYSIHGNGSLDVGHLRSTLSDLTEEEESCQSLLYAIKNILLSAKALASQKTGDRFLYIYSLLTLNRWPMIEFDGTNIDAILAHQVLGTLSQPIQNTWGLPCFTSWYKSSPAHPNAVNGYIHTIINHFGQGGYARSLKMRFMLETDSGMPDPAACTVVPSFKLQIIPKEYEPSAQSGNDECTPFVLVAAHSQPGPGPTATHEERLQSASPFLSLSSLVCPLIPPNAALLTSAVPVHAAWRGHNRTARLERLFPVNERPSRHYILADALELDTISPSPNSGLSDLQPENIKREVGKLYAAFLGARREAERMHYKECVIEAAAWGCAAFGGHVVAKTSCMMIAAGLASARDKRYGYEDGSPVYIKVPLIIMMTLLENRVEEVEAVKDLLERQWTVMELWERMRSDKVRARRTTKELCEALMAS